MSTPNDSTFTPCSTILRFGTCVDTEIYEEVVRAYGYPPETLEVHPEKAMLLSQTIDRYSREWQGVEFTKLEDLLKNHGVSAHEAETRVRRLLSDAIATALEVDMQYVAFVLAGEAAPQFIGEIIGYINAYFPRTGGILTSPSGHEAVRNLIEAHTAA